MKWETIQVEADKLVERINQIVSEGNVRRIRLRQDDRVLFDIPLAAGVGIGAVAVLAAPVVVAVAAVAAVITHCTLEIEREEPPMPPTEPPIVPPTDV